MKLKNLNEEYKLSQKREKDKIKAEPNKFKRFLKWCVFLIIFPWKWLWYNIRDWRTAVIFAIVALLVSSEVWVPYLIGLITWGTELSKWMIGFATGCWLFWAGPGTPFLVICIFLTMGIKEILNIKEVKNGRKR